MKNRSILVVLISSLFLSGCTKYGTIGHSIEDTFYSARTSDIVHLYDDLSLTKSKDGVSVSITNHNKIPEIRHSIEAGLLAPDDVKQKRFRRSRESYQTGVLSTYEQNNNYSKTGIYRNTTSYNKFEYKLHIKTDLQEFSSTVKPSDNNYGFISVKKILSTLTHEPSKIEIIVEAKDNTQSVVFTQEEIMAMGVKNKQWELDDFLLELGD